MQDGSAMAAEKRRARLVSIGLGVGGARVVCI
jgi:hypothetical protein